MDIYIVRQLLLVIHISGLVLSAGITVAGYALAQAPKALDKTFGIGATLLLLSGIGLMWLTHGVFLQQPWMQVKLGLVVLLVLNEILVGKRVATVTKMNRYYMSQLVLFLGIITMAIFKFS
jgi:uncharacterized membrane protein SirB2